jgi:hypothetical protein
VSKRLGLLDELGPAGQDDAVKVELLLNAQVVTAERGVFSLRMILHGRATCLAGEPASAFFKKFVNSLKKVPCHRFFGGPALPWLSEPVPATWFRKSRRWDPPPGRLAQCRPFGAGIGVSGPCLDPAWTLPAPYLEVVWR